MSRKFSINVTLSVVAETDADSIDDIIDSLDFSVYSTDERTTVENFDIETFIVK